MIDAVLSIDVSLDRLDVALRTDDAGWQWPHRAYPNNWPGYRQLRTDLLAGLSSPRGAQLTAVAESTGPYWMPLFYHLERDEGLRACCPPLLALLNPRHVKAFRKALPEQDKNDLLDAQLIGRYYQTVGVKHFHHFDDRYLPLRFLTRSYARIVHSLAAEKAWLRSVLAVSASDYQRQKPLSDLFGVSGLHLLDEFDDIQSLADAPLDDLSDKLRLFSGNSFTDPLHTAKSIKQSAGQSYPLSPSLNAALHAVVQLAVARIHLLADNQKSTRHLIEQQLQNLPEADFALAQHGLGSILVAGCLSEIQDTSRFISGIKFDRKRKRLRSRRSGRGCQTGRPVVASTRLRPLSG